MLKWLSGTAGATIVAAVITGLCGIGVTLFTSSKLSTEETSQKIVVAASDYPFKPSSIVIERGDDVEISVEDHDATWSCDPAKPAFAGPEGYRLDRSPNTLLPSANFCELVGSVQPGLFFRVGPYFRFTALQAGNLSLGTNDWGNTSPSSICGNDCYKDNIATLNVTVTIRKNRTR